jgi:hypothetical protein
LKASYAHITLNNKSRSGKNAVVEKITNEKGVLMRRSNIVAYMVLFSLVLLFSTVNPAIGKEKTVVLNVPACGS